MRSVLIVFLAAIVVFLISCCNWAQAGAGDDLRLQYARQLLSRQAPGQKAVLQIDTRLTNPESFSIRADKETVTITGGGPAGVLYGTQRWISSPADVQETIENPDFELRSTVLFLMKDGSYDYELTEEEFPWFYDRQLLSKYLDYLFENRFNAIFIWTGHLFPSIVEMPDYPDASSLTVEQLSHNNQQFKWFTHECAKRNISVLLHFYNIHISKALAKSRDIAVRHREPNDFVKKYVQYSLRRFLKEFDSVGLYVCPGETLRMQYQPQWIRDVIFAAAKESGSNPLIVVRDWYLDADGFRKVCSNQYDNLYTEAKHNIEMLVSPVPDERHASWKDVAKKHIVNLHEIADVKPFRWASPAFIQEMVREWKKIGLDGAEVYAMVSWRWPYSLDKLEQSQINFWPAGHKLLTFERDAVWLQAIGRYLWKVNRDPQQEEEYWADQLAQKFGSEKAGRLLLQWYDTTGPILPGLQNLTSVNNQNGYPTAIGKEQGVDEILDAGKHRWAVRGNGYFRPVDTYFFQRYKEKYNLPELNNRVTIKIAEYADRLAKGEIITDAMTPDKVVELLVELAQSSVGIARQAYEAAAKNKAEAARFVTDSQAMLYITQAWRHKIMAAIEKRLLVRTGKAEHQTAFIKHIRNSIDVYEKLVELTDKTYINATDVSMNLNWHNGLEQFRADLSKQNRFLATKFQITKLTGVHWLEAEEMEGNWKYDQRYHGYYGSGYMRIDKPEQIGTALKKRVDIDETGHYTVWTRGILTKGADCAFAVEVAGEKLPATHGGRGPENEQFVWAWQEAGWLDLEKGPAEVMIRQVGKDFCVDLVLLTKDPNLIPTYSKLFEGF